MWYRLLLLNEWETNLAALTEIQIATVTCTPAGDRVSSSRLWPVRLYEQRLYDVRGLNKGDTSPSLYGAIHSMVSSVLYDGIGTQVRASSNLRDCKRQDSHRYRTELAAKHSGLAVAQNKLGLRGLSNEQTVAFKSQDT